MRTDLTLTDDRGAFTLALRWVAPGTLATVAALDRRSRRRARHRVAVAEDLPRNQLITIT
jgi:hypothetical protein